MTYLSALSLDTVVGVGAGILFFQHIFETQLPGILCVGLLGGTWVLYTADRLFDDVRFIMDYSVKTPPFRHYLHHQISHVLWWFVGMGLVILGGVFFMFVPRLYFGIVLGLLCLFFLHHLCMKWAWYGFFKEWVVMAVYMVALIGPFILQLNISFQYFVREYLLIIILYGLLVFLNLALSCFIEYRFRHESGRFGLHTCFTQYQLSWAIRFILGVLLFLWLGAASIGYDGMVLLVLGLMIVCSGIVFVLDWSCRDFHGYAELIFWIPLLVVLG